jgi:hypothetical protein
VENAPAWVDLHDKAGTGTGAIGFSVQRMGDGKRSGTIVVNKESVTVVQFRSR